MLSSIIIAQMENRSWSELISLGAASTLSLFVEQFGSVIAIEAGQNSCGSGNEEVKMLWTIFVALVILWLLGFSLHVAGGLIHLLLVVALVVLVINLVSGRRLV